MALVKAPLLSDSLSCFSLEQLAGRSNFTMISLVTQVKFSCMNMALRVEENNLSRMTSPLCLLQLQNAMLQKIMHFGNRSKDNLWRYG